MNPTVDVIVPVHNRWELTRTCLEHLERQSLAHTVFVCDNGSTDGTIERLRADFPDVRVVELGANVGFPAACNRGARAGKGDIVVLLNNDVEAPPSFLEKLVAPLASDSLLGSVAALLLQPGGERIESFGLTADRTLAGFPRSRGQRVEAGIERHRLIGPSGAAGAYRRTAWQEVRGLDEGVFYYGEDVDLALRLRAAGWSTAEAPSAVAIHLGSASATQRSVWQRYQGGFSRGYFLRSHGTLRSTAALHAAVMEAIVVVADALVFSHDLSALRGRVAGWRRARGSGQRLRLPEGVVDERITFLQSLRMRINAYARVGH